MNYEQTQQGGRNTEKPTSHGMSPGKQACNISNFDPWSSDASTRKDALLSSSNNSRPNRSKALAYAWNTSSLIAATAREGFRPTVES